MNNPSEPPPDRLSSGGPSSGEVVLTVVVACLNAAGTLGEQLEALATQFCPVPWELLICDNGSTDATADVVAGFAARLPIVSVDASARRGPGAARNIGADRARGRWLAFCDADDVVAEDWLERMCAALARHEFVAGRFEGRRLNSSRTLRSRALDQQEGLQRSADGRGLPHAGAGNMGMHLEVFRRVGGFDPDVPCLEDTELSWRIQRHGVVLEYLPDLVVHVRLRATLVDMYRQAFGYGLAHALIECRHGHGGDDTDDQGGRIVASDGGRGPRAVLRAWLGGRPSLGRLVWQWGWHRGYHHGLRRRPVTDTVSVRGVGAVDDTVARGDTVAGRQRR